MPEKILVVDDERGIRYSLKRMFEERGFKVLEAKNGKEAIETVQKDQIDLILMDVKMAGITGLEALKEIRSINPKLLVIIMTAYGTTQTAIEAMKFGAFDYILKPFDIPQMWRSIEKGLHVNKLMREAVTYEPEKCQIDAECIIGNSPKMQEVYKLIGQVAEKDITVLLRGESGTGKELVARAIYHHSKRSDKTFLPVNCAAIPETLLESELFGYEKGAFTDAQTSRIGKFEQCSGGTIFLDEIGDMSLTTQAKILRFLQEKEITRLGSNERIKVDVRLIVATNKDLEKAIREGRFRKDLYYRLNVVSINLPLLRQRREDIPQLARYFLKKFNKELDKDIVDINPEAMEKLMGYRWPGNVRQLENVIKRACILCKGAYILRGELSLDLKEVVKIKREEKTDEEGLEKLLDDLYTKISAIPKEDREDITPLIEKGLIIRALKETNGNQLQAAQILGINRNTLRNKIEKYGIKISKRVEI
ncbi:MAG: sigma-54-dependent transcriptional regulator [bacterium]